MGIFKGLKNEFKIAVVNEPSVFEPLTVYCIMLQMRISILILSNNATPKNSERKKRN